MNFDKNKLLESAGGDEELARELVGIFQDECPALLGRIGQAVQEGQPQQLHEAAHTLKGSLGSMGANAVLDQVVILEGMGLNDDMQQADTVLELLKSQMDLLVQDLKAYERISV